MLSNCYYGLIMKAIFPNQNILVKYRELNAGTKFLEVNLFSN